MRNSRQIDRLTNNSDETSIAGLISGDNVFSIPYFQRAYKWKPEKLRQLNQDILNIVDGETDFHFLGAIIIHGRKSSPADPDVYEVIDGQQRLTTLFLYMAAAIKTLCQVEEYEEAQSLLLKYLVIGRNTKLISNYKLHSCKEDRAQLNAVFKDLFSNKRFSDLIKEYKLTPLPSNGEEKGVLWNNYKASLRFFKTQLDQGDLERIRQIYLVVLQKMSVVQIDVWDPTNGPKIFDSLNSRQEPMTIGDLVRNEIFSKVANEEPDYVEEIDHHHWQPFYNKFKTNGENLFDQFFFPFGLIQDPNLKKSEVYEYLREDWKHKGDPKEIIESLAYFQDSFLDIVKGTNLTGHSTIIATAFKNLSLLGLPSSTYPFLMKLSKSIEEQLVSVTVGREIIELIESFLTRRAICGYEPTGLHAVFKRLWNDCKSDISAASVSEQIKKHKTVTWPNDQEFQSAIQTRPLYGSTICPYFILKFNEAAGGDQPNNINWIEHILPEKPEKEWFEIFSKEEHERLKDTIANLLPLSQQMNISLGNRLYSVKRDRYENDSMFKSSRELAKTYTEWTPFTMAERAIDISTWGLKRWPY